MMELKRAWIIFPLLGLIALISVILPSGAIGDAEIISPDYERSDLRAFYTAPPVIPHEITEQDGTSCLGCHSDVIQPGDRTSVKTPHPGFSNCLQCHVMGIPAFGDTTIAENDWQGLEEPTEGYRASDVSPPTIPHRLFLREDCLSCHHANARDVSLRCPHPERSSCTQCHVAEESNEF